MKKIRKAGCIAISLVLGITQPNINGFGKSIGVVANEYTNAKDELEETKTIIEDVILETKEEELEELQSVKVKKGKKERKEINREIKEVKKIEKMEDFPEYNKIIDKKTGEEIKTVSDAKKFLEENGYDYEEWFVDLCTNIEEYKNRNISANTVEIVQNVNAEREENEI